VMDPWVQAGGHFGSSLAFAGKTLVVGEPGATPNGGAYVFHVDGALWSNLTKSCVSNCSGFGTSVASSGARVVVGAPGSGRAYVFTPAGKLLSTLTSPCVSTWASCGGFGTSVAIAGNTVLVGAPGDGYGWYGAGTAYAYNLTTGALNLNLTSPYAQTGGCFGQSVAMEKSAMVVGAPCEKLAGAGGTPGTGVGNVYVFYATNGSLFSTSSGSQAAEYFGWSVAVNGSRVIAGAPDYIPPLKSGSGGAFVFDLNGTQLFGLLSSAPVNGGEFGESVAIGSNWISVGAPDENGHVGSTKVIGAGHAYLFNASGALVYWHASPNLQAGGTFGSAVAIGSGKLVVGAADESVSAHPQAGQVYVCRA
jgi:hypothetical protein